MRIRVTIISVIFTVFAAYSQDIAVRALLDTNKALIGDQITLHLSAEKPVRDWHINFPQINDTITSAIEIVSKSDPDTISVAGGRQTINQDLVITVFDTGFFEIPALSFGIVSNNFRDTISTLPVVFEIVPVKADTAIRDIKAIYRMPLSIAEVTKYSGMILAIVVLALLIFYFLKHRKTKDSLKPLNVYTEPADVMALRELEKLKQEKPWTDSRLKYYYSRISEILRLYIERRYNIPAPEQTTDEILTSLKPPVCDSKEYNRLLNILRLSDLVKFAKVVPDLNESALQVDSAAEFVKNTPVIVPATEPEPEKENITMQSN